MKYLLMAGGALALVLATAAIDPLDQIRQDIDDLKARVEYLERFSPIDTFDAITGVGSSAELAAAINRRVEIADGISVAVTSARMIRRHSEIEVLPEWATPPLGYTLVAVEVTVFNTGEWDSRLNAHSCSENPDTFAVDRDCEGMNLWHVVVDGSGYPVSEYPLIGIDDSPLVGPSGQYNKWDAVRTRIDSTLYFHTRGNALQGVLAYKHPVGEHSHRYWKLRQTRR